MGLEATVRRSARIARTLLPFLLTSGLLAACAGSGPTSSPSAAPTPTPTQAPSPTPESYTIEGAIQVAGLVAADGSGCYSSNYGDVTEGANVVVTDEKGTVVGTTNLGASHRLEGAPTEFPCVFDISIKVPKANFYTIKVGRRDGPTMSFEQMTSAGWRWDLSIGI